MRSVGPQSALLILGEVFILLEIPFCACLSLSAADAEEAFSDASAHYVFKQWKTDQDLPQNTVRCLLQSHDGYVWVGTQAGLARFNGLRFTNFTKANTPEMTSDNCVTLAEGPDGALWVGTEDGLLKRAAGRFARVDLGATNAEQRYIRSIWISRHGTVWIGTYDGLYELNDGRLARHTITDGLQGNIINAVFEDGDGNVWVGAQLNTWPNGKLVRARGGLQRRKTGARRFDLLPGEEGTNALHVINCVVEDFSGHFWWGNDTGAHQLAGGTVRNFHIQDGLSGEGVWRLAPCRDGSVLALVANRQEARGQQGLHKFDPVSGRFRSIPLPSFAMKSDIICALEDLEGGVWVGTRFNGLLLLRAHQIQSFTARNGLSHERVNAALDTPDGVLQLGTTEGWDQLQDGATSPTREYLEQDNTVYSFTKDHLGRIWLGHRIWPGVNDSEVWVFTDKRMAGGEVNLPNEIIHLKNSPINCLGVDLENAVWIGQPDGVSRVLLTGNTARSLDRPVPPQRFTKNEGLSSDDIRCVVADGDGGVWLGTHGGGLNRWNGARFETFTVEDGLCSQFVRTIYQDADRTLWIGTDAGLNRLKDRRFSRVTTKNGLPSERINQILEDDDGFLWLGCEQTVLRVSRLDLNAVADSRSETIHPVIFGEADGLPGGEISRYQPGASKTRDGRLLIPTSKGLAVINPNRIHDPLTLPGNQVPPPVVIEQVTVDGEILYGDGVAAPVKARDVKSEIPNSKSQIIHPAPSQPRLRLAPGRARVLDIRYTANSFVAPEKIRFQYRLEGRDPGWIDAGGRREVLYTSLAPGEYRFHVKACNSHGILNEAGDQFAFYLAPHFYQTRPFYGACVLALLGAAFGVHRYRLSWQRRILELEHQHAVERERRRIADDMQDDLGAGLTKIKLLTELVEADSPSEARTHMQNIARTTRDVAQGMDEIVWTVNPENDTLEGLIGYLGRRSRQRVRSSRKTHGSAIDSGCRGPLEKRRIQCLCPPVWNAFYFFMEPEGASGRLFRGL